MVDIQVYTTVQGDTWDLIAYNLFGAEAYMQQLIEANPDLVDIFVFSAGTEIIVPEIEDADDPNALPIWRTSGFDDDTVDEDDMYDPDWEDIDDTPDDEEDED